MRLFERPDAQRLDELDEAQRFALACVVWHESLAVSEASLTLRYSERACRDALHRLAELGVIFQREDRRFAVVTEWWPTAVRFLRRKHLIDS